jgi:acyl-CoA synthetase (AMP-forming)/AMP-acid ligase II
VKLGQVTAHAPCNPNKVMQCLASTSRSLALTAWSCPSTARILVTCWCVGRGWCATRSKDVIKSGAEWIGSIDLEIIAMAHPAVAQAACIAAKHPKWDERPLLIVVRKPQAELTREELLAFYKGKIEKCWTPTHFTNYHTPANVRFGQDARRKSPAQLPHQSGVYPRVSGPLPFPEG